EERSALPSFLYLSLKEERKKGSLAVSWDPERDYCVGHYAKERGEELPGRLVSSAKSWLSHSDCDRREAILTWGADGVDGMLSPVDASARYLSHLREVWDLAHPDAPLAQQRLFVTVPASFDPSACQLVEEACDAAGLGQVVLLEEPQAAFYAWLHRHQAAWREQLSVGDTVLVVDIGGGTTDFSLISVSDNDGDLQLERIAVGSHLLLGGDNMDLALAYVVRQKLEEEGHDIDDWQFQALTHAARRAKERLLSEDAPESVDISIRGRGGSLIGSTLTSSLSREEALSLVVEGFAPLLDRDEHPAGTSSGMRQIGLPYAEDARITSHLAKFLSRSGEGSNDVSAFLCPRRVLFNGGSLKADALRGRILQQLQQWSIDADPTEVLDGADLDCAVSRGAVYYGLAREGKAIRIKGGTSRSYFIGVEDAVPAVPGLPRPMKAICVVPFGMEE
ncbi:MAG: Hsp70 family protein, partial [Chlamydiia bacterium]|nr:Hsp70 family protein [Chlamydiia bacterium]